LCNAEQKKGIAVFTTGDKYGTGDWMSGSENVVVYRLHAAQCAEIAERSSDPKTRDSLLIMSAQWLLLADLAEKNSKSQPPTAAVVQSRDSCRSN
jgi:hypothetical protein